jgi:hypothetical protein
MEPCDTVPMLADCCPVLYTTIDHLRTSAVLHRQADAVGDDAASLRVYVVIAVLIVIGVLLIALAVWLVRQTRPDPELLAPLERMDARQWRKLGPQDRRRALDDVRPAGAIPLDRAKSEPKVDQDFAATRPVRDFSDLADTPATEPAGTPAGTSNDEPDVSPVEERDETVTIDAVEPEPVEPAAEAESPAAAAAAAATATADSDDAVPPGDDTSPLEQPDVVAPNGDDTGELANDAEFDVPLMPGEGLLRRPRSDADHL